MSDTAGDQMKREAQGQPEPGACPRAMSDSASFVRSAGEGLISGLFYLFVVFAPLFLVPVQIAYGRGGRRCGKIAAGMAAFVVAVAQAVRLALGGSFGLGLMAASVVPPIVLLAALVLLNAAFWSRSPATYRILAIAAICALALIPLIREIGRDEAFLSSVESRIEEVFAPIRAQEGRQPGDRGYDASALAAALDPKALAATSLRVLASSYAGLLVLILGGSWWLGNRSAGPGSQGRSVAPALSAYRVPYALVWAFLASWAAVLATMFVRGLDALQTAAWNCALAFSLPYAAQGAGIASSFFDRWKMPRFTRVLIAATAIAALATPTAGTVVAIALPLLGVTEVWIPYRTTKGVGA
jgi:hypothetical protein